MASSSGKREKKLQATNNATLGTGAALDIVFIREQTHQPANELLAPEWLSQPLCQAS